MKATWTETRIARLTELWHDGVSAGLIAKQMGLSKNAVVGKAHRLELAGRPSPILRNVPRTRKREERLARATTSVDKNTPISESVAPVPAQQENAATMRTERARVAREERAAQAAQSTTQRWHISQAQAKAEQDLRRERGQELLPLNMTRQFTRNTGMKFSECQFIAGEKGIDFKFYTHATPCRTPVRPGSPYCQAHHLRCHSKQPLGEAVA